MRTNVHNSISEINQFSNDSSKTNQIMCKYGLMCRFHMLNNCKFVHPTASGGADVSDIDSANDTRIVTNTFSASLVPKKYPTDFKVDKLLKELINDPTVNIETFYQKEKAGEVQVNNLTCVLLGFSDNMEDKYLDRRMIKLYNIYCSDHALVISRPEVPGEPICVSFNVEHNAHVKERITKFVNSVNSKLNANKKLELPQNRINTFVQDILYLKNKQILDLIRRVISQNSRMDIIFNFQEVSPSLFCELANELKSMKCQMTKLTCQHVLEACQEYDNEKLKELGLSGTDRPDPIKISEYIDELKQKIPKEFDPNKHSGRFSVNGSFLSLVYSSGKDVRSNIEIYDYKAEFPKSEDDFAKLAMIANNLPENQHKFLRSRPVVTYSKICNTQSRMLQNGVMLGSMFLICRGILLEDFSTVNYHGHITSMSTEYLLGKINCNSLDTLFNVFENDFERNTIYTEKPSSIDFGIEMYMPLITSFANTLSNTSSTIKCIAGDFNMSDTKFQTYQLTDTSEDFIGTNKVNKNDRILRINISFRSSFKFVSKMDYCVVRCYYCTDPSDEYYWNDREWDIYWEGYDWSNEYDFYYDDYSVCFYDKSDDKLT